jgi:multisubunit Na+/H+ antiporter MnhC subunit
MMKKSEKSISTPFKITIVSSVLLIVINFAFVLFVLLPIYDLAGDNVTTTLEKDKKLDEAEAKTDVVIGVSAVLAIVSLGSVGYGVYKEIETSDKSKKTTKPKDKVKSTTKKTLKKKK